MANPGSFDLSPHAPPVGTARGRPSRGLDLRVGPVADSDPGQPHSGRSAGVVSVEGAGPDYAHLLHDFVQARVFYPDRAAEAGEDGMMVVEFDIDHDGHVHDLVLDTTTGSRTLDAAFMGILRGANLPRPPPGGPALFHAHFQMTYTLIRR